MKMERKKNGQRMREKNMIFNCFGVKLWNYTLIIFKCVIKGVSHTHAQYPCIPYSMRGERCMLQWAIFVHYKRRTHQGAQCMTNNSKKTLRMGITLLANDVDFFVKINVWSSIIIYKYYLKKVCRWVCARKKMPNNQQYASLS